MIRSHLIGRENRLLHKTLAQIQEEQRKAGTTVSGNAPINARAAQEAAKLQNANRQTERYVNPDADLVERMVQTNFDYSKATPQEIARHEEGLRLASAGPAPRGVNPATGVQTAQQQTYANKAAGLDTTFNQETGVTQAAGQGGIEQSAIDNMRRNGLSEDEIRANLSSPDRMNSIRTTMSNTGLGGTDRQSAVLTPAQAQSILANSRNPKQRADAQKVIDDQVNQVKGYNDVPIYDDNGNITGYNSVESKGKTAEAQQAERNRLAMEESNRLKSQENADKLKKFTAGIDTSQIDQTKTQLDQIMGSIANLSPDLQAAVLPRLIDLQNSTNEIDKMVNEMISSQPTDAELEAKGDTMETHLKEQDAKLRDFMARNSQTQVDIADYNRKAIELEKQLIDHDAGVAEQKQLAANIDNEKKIRRQLNRLGIQTDLSGLDYLQKQIQEGVTTYDNLKKGNNLVSLRAQLAIGEGYKLEVRQIMEDLEGKYMNADALLYEKTQEIKNSISTAKADRAKSIIDQRKWAMELKRDDEKEGGKLIFDANIKMIDSSEKQKDRDLRSEENRLAREDRADARYEAALARGDTAAARIEQKSADTMFREMSRLNTRMNTDPVLKPYAEQKMKFAVIDADYKRTMDNFAKYENGEIDKPTMNLIDQALINGINKMWDESSVVRESEYARTPAGMSIKNRLESWVSNKLNGGIMNESERTAVKDAMDTMFGVWQTAADDSLDKFYLQINKTNSQLLPQDWLSPEDFGLPATNTKGSGIETEYDNSSIETLLQSKSEDTEITEITLGGRKVRGASIAMNALQKADEEFFADTGKHFIIDSSHRTTEQQQVAYERFLKGEIAAAAPPGQSLHEKGIAFDIHNNAEARPYLIRYGFKQFDTKKDPGHFSFRTVG